MTLFTKSPLVIAFVAGSVVILSYFVYSKRKSRSEVKKKDYISVTCSAPVNMAVIKYWGKRDDHLNLPLNSSLSTTLHQDDLKTVTTIFASKSFKEDELYLNGDKEDVSNERIQNCFEEIRRRATPRIEKETGKVLISREEWQKYKVQIHSINNFPTAAGLASSASGYCCLVYALAQLYGVQGDISVIARRGSGSACRSMYGGFVAWDKGEAEDGSDSKAIQIADEAHWPDLNILVLVVQDQKKETSSTSGMQRSAKTSSLLKIRAESVVPKRMKEMEEAILKRDFQAFAELTMKDSQDFHAVCADTDPPIYYLNHISKSIIDMVEAFNRDAGQLKAAFTFDAGPNAVIYTLKRDLPAVLATILKKFPPSLLESSFFQKEDILEEAKKVEAKLYGECLPNSLKYILHTSVGPGPQILTEQEAVRSSPL